MKLTPVVHDPFANPALNVARRLRRDDGGVVDPYTTQLTPEEEVGFQAWKQQYAPNDSGYDYDLRGAYKAGLTPAGPEAGINQGHFDDRFKKPNHPTFSIYSQYAKDAPELAGTWEGNQYIPPVTAHYKTGGSVTVSHKLTKAAVDYSKGKPSSHCGICAYYNDRICSKVRGDIDPTYWCELFRKVFAYGGRVAGFADGGMPDNIGAELPSYQEPPQEYSQGPIAGFLAQPSWLEQASEEAKKGAETYQQTGSLGAMLADTQAGQQLAGGFGGTTYKVYHGLGAPIEGNLVAGHPYRYDPGFMGSAGVYSTNRPHLANDYATLKAAKEIEPAPNVMPLNLEMNNPLIISSAEKKRLSGLPQSERDKWLQDVYAKGHDGVIVQYGEGNPDLRSSGYQEYLAPAEQYSPRFARATTSPPPKIEPKPNELGYYSAVGHAVDTAGTNKATPQQWLGTIRNTPGVKSEELQWTGLEDWLKSQQGPVTKQEVQDYLRGNQLEVKDVTKGTLPVMEWKPHTNPDYADGLLGYDPNGKLAVEIIPTGQNRNRYLVKYLRGARLELPASSIEQAQTIARELTAESVSPTKFGSYIKNKGDNYKETLLTLPDRTGALDARKEIFDKYAPDIQAIHRELETRGLDPRRRDWLDSQRTMLEDQRDMEADRAAKLPETSMFRSGHWDEPNVVAHVLHSERDIGGKRYLQIHEVQSDWHQKGQAEGYATPTDLSAIRNAESRFEQAKNGLRNLGVEWEGDKTAWAIYKNGNRLVPVAPFEISPGQWQVRDLNGKLPSYITNPEALPTFPSAESAWRDSYKSNPPHPMSKDEFLAWNELQNSHTNLGIARVAEQNKPKIPDAPFKSTWHELALKRMLKYAADNNFDGILVDKGQTVADRYDLSKHVSKIEYELSNDGNYEIAAYDLNGNAVMHEDEVPLTRVQELVGKEMAEKIKNQEGVEDRKLHGGYRDWRTLSGLDLKVGGEFHKKLYDEKIPQALNKLGKKYGAKVDENGIVPGTPEAGLSYKQILKAVGYTSDEWQRMTKQQRSKILLEKGIGVLTHKFDITPQMRNAIQQRGFPQFARGGKIGPRLTAVAHDPWKTHSAIMRVLSRREH